MERSKCQGRTEGEPDEMRSLDPQCPEEPGQAVGVGVHSEVLRGVRRPTCPGCVPCDHGELIGERLDLTAPGRPGVADEAVRQCYCRPGPGALEGDTQLANLDVLRHG
jgi:hypothetical protein